MPYNLVELIEIITKLIGDWEMRFLRECEEAGFTARQIEYIDIIDKLDNPSLGEIAKVLELSKPSVTAIVDNLVKKGYIEKFQSDEDRRIFHVHLSDKGKQLVKMHQETHNRIADLFRHNLDSDDLEVLVSILNKVVSRV